MNKKLAALAVAGALALPMAAEAQTANVTLYGRMHLDMEEVSGTLANGTNPHVFRVSSNTSRFGIRGVESLGGGLNAIFQIESSVQADAGGSTLASRETFVGLQGAWGTFKMGNFLTPFDDVHPVFFNPSQLGSSILATSAIWGQGAAGNLASGGFDVRVPNSIRYDSPNMSGFTGSIQYGTLEGTPKQNSGVVSVGLFYVNGPINIGSSYQRHNSVRAVGLNDEAWTIAAAYNFGGIRPALVYEHEKYETPTGDLKHDFWGGSLSWTLGAGVLYGFWGHAGDGKGSAANGTRIFGSAKGSDTSSDMWELSYGYALSKRTNVYAGYVKIDNECNAAYTFNINPYSGAATGTKPVSGCWGKPEGWVLGVLHNF